jgi:hypothetical protein
MPVLLVPQQGVTRSPTGDATALVLGEGNKVERRRLQLARAVGNQWLVTSGLKAGDKLIVEGLQRARPGQTVTPVAGRLGAQATRARPPRPPRPRADLASHGLVLHRPAHLCLGAGHRHHAGRCSARHSRCRWSATRHRAHSHVHQHQLSRRVGQAPSKTR